MGVCLFWQPAIVVDYCCWNCYLRCYLANKILSFSLFLSLCSRNTHPELHILHCIEQYGKTRSLISPISTYLFIRRLSHCLNCSSDLNANWQVQLRGLIMHRAREDFDVKPHPRHAVAFDLRKRWYFSPGGSIGQRCHFLPNYFLLSFVLAIQVFPVRYVVSYC